MTVLHYFMSFVMFHQIWAAREKNHGYIWCIYSTRLHVCHKILLYAERNLINRTHLLVILNLEDLIWGTPFCSLKKKESKHSVFTKE